MCREAAYGRLLAKYMDDESNIFIISSDFCHWGSRFSYTFNDSSKVDTLHVFPLQSPNSGMTDVGRETVTIGTGMFSVSELTDAQGPIYKAIEWLDTQGMDIIEQVMS